MEYFLNDEALGKQPKQPQGIANANLLNISPKNLDLLKDNNTINNKGVFN